MPIVKNETEKEIVSDIEKIEDADIETEAKIEVEKEQTIQLLESTRQTGEEVTLMRKVSEEKKIHAVELDRIINYFLLGSNPNTNSSLKREAPKANLNAIS